MEVFADVITAIGRKQLIGTGAYPTRCPYIPSGGIRGLVFYVMDE